MKLLFIIAFIAIFNTTAFAEIEKIGDTNLSETAIVESSFEGRFKVAGSDKVFSLIDTNNGYFVIADNDYGVYSFSEGTQRFNPEDTGNIAYFLNNDFLSEEYTGEKLPDEIISNIIEHTWDIEPGNTSGDCPDKYKINCKIGLLSAQSGGNAQ